MPGPEELPHWQASPSREPSLSSRAKPPPTQPEDEGKAFIPDTSVPMMGGTQRAMYASAGRPTMSVHADYDVTNYAKSRWNMPVTPSRSRSQDNPTGSAAAHGDKTPAYSAGSDAKQGHGRISAGAGAISRMASSLLDASSSIMQKNLIESSEEESGDEDIHPTIVFHSMLDWSNKGDLEQERSPALLSDVQGLHSGSPPVFTATFSDVDMPADSRQGAMLLSTSPVISLGTHTSAVQTRPPDADTPYVETRCGNFVRVLPEQALSSSHATEQPFQLSTAPQRHDIAASQQPASSAERGGVSLKPSMKHGPEHPLSASTSPVDNDTSSSRQDMKQVPEHPLSAPVDNTSSGRTPSLLSPPSSSSPFAVAMQGARGHDAAAEGARARGSRRGGEGTWLKSMLAGSEAGGAEEEEAKLTVLQAGHDMQARLRFDLSRMDLLAICRNVGISSSSRTNLGSLVALRDMQVLQTKSEPAILVRRGAILVSLDPIKAIITAHELYVLVPDGSDSVLEPLRIRLDHAAKQRLTAHACRGGGSGGGGGGGGGGNGGGGGGAGAANVAFEFAAMEVMFMSAAAIKRRAALHTSQEAQQVLGAVRHTLSSRLLARVLRLKKRLAEVHTGVRACQDAFEQVQEEEVMALMYLTALDADPTVFAARVRSGSWNTDEIELLLDSYEQEMRAISKELTALEHDIDATEALLKLKLDTARNNLIKVDVSFGVAALWLTACALISAYYGMNLVNGHENDADSVMASFGVSRIWLQVCLISAGASLALILATLLLLWGTGLFQS